VQLICNQQVVGSNPTMTSIFMKPTYEFCSNCKTTTQHLNGFCSCYEQTPPFERKVLKVEHYSAPVDVIEGIKELQTIYSKISNV
jgi:predicted amidophosphoribosyltransferase